MEELRVARLGRAPRVLVSGVVLDQPMGGVWRHNLELLPRVAALLESEGGGLAVLTGRGGTTFELPAPVEVLPGDVPARPLLTRPFREARALTELSRARDFDLVHVGHLPAPRGLPVPITQTIHDLRALDLPQHTAFSRRLVARAVVGRALDRAAAVFAVSEWMAERLRGGWPAAAEKIVLVPNAGDHLRALPRAPGPDACLLHVGHVEPRKNLELVLRALAAAPDLPDLCLAGGVRDDEGERLLALARELGVQGRLRIEGPCEERALPEKLAECAAVVLPSRLEGFGIVALEARAAGCPLALSDIGAHREVVGTRGGADWFAPDDVEGCVRALRAAVERVRVPPPSDLPRWEDSARRWARGLVAAATRGRSGSG